MEGKKIVQIMTQLLRRVIRRKILAMLFIILISILFLWSIKEDYELKRFGKGLELKRDARNIYLLHLDSFDPIKKTVNGTLTLQPGSPISDILKYKIRKEPSIFYGPLNFQDLSHPFSYLFFDLIKKFTIVSKMENLRHISYSTTYPPPINISVQPIGNPEIYPFDKYLIVGIITCPTYFEEENKRIYVDSIEDGESLSIRNLMAGLFIRYPTSGEFKYKDKFNDFRNNFALMIERPSYLKFMTIILVIFALGTSFYIGFKSAPENLIIQIIGYIVSLWGIRSIILSDSKIFLSYLDYALLFAYLLLFVGIFYRLIRGDLTSYLRKL
jgi:hypothetical protein